MEGMRSNSHAVQVHGCHAAGKRRHCFGVTSFVFGVFNIITTTSIIILTPPLPLQAYSPLTKGQKLDDKRLATIAAKYSKTPAQILIRFGIDQVRLELTRNKRNPNLSFVSGLGHVAQVYDSVAHRKQLCGV